MTLANKKLTYPPSSKCRADWTIIVRIRAELLKTQEMDGFRILCHVYAEGDEGVVGAPLQKKLDEEPDQRLAGAETGCCRLR